MPRAFRAPRVASFSCHEARTRQAPKPPPTLASDQADGFGSQPCLPSPLPAHFNISEYEDYVFEHPSWVSHMRGFAPRSVLHTTFTRLTRLTEPFVHVITTWVPNVLNILCQSPWRHMSQLTIDRGSIPVAKRDSQIKSCALLAFRKLLRLSVISRATQANSSMSC